MHTHLSRIQITGARIAFNYQHCSAHYHRARIRVFQRHLPSSCHGVYVTCGQPAFDFHSDGSATGLIDAFILFLKRVFLYRASVSLLPGNNLAIFS
jgi:hypothetical protein